MSQDKLPSGGVERQYISGLSAKLGYGHGKTNDDHAGHLEGMFRRGRTLADSNSYQRPASLSSCATMLHFALTH